MPADTITMNFRQIIVEKMAINVMTVDNIVVNKMSNDYRQDGCR